MKKLTIIVLLCFGYGATFSQKKIDYPNYGFSFEIPEGWSGQESEESYIMSHPNIPGFIVLTLHEAPDQRTLLSEAKAGLQDANGTNLKALETPQTYEKQGVACLYGGTIEWQQAKAYGIALLSPNGGGLTILAAVSEELFTNDHIQYAKNVAASVKFTRIEKPSVSEEWKSNLSNVRLTYIDSYSSNTTGGGGYSQQTKIDLCAAGYFNYKDSDINAFGQHAGAYSQTKGGGTWSLESGKSENNPILKLSFYDGTVYTFELSHEDNKLYLNGYRYFRTYANDGTEEFRPLCD